MPGETEASQLVGYLTLCLKNVKLISSYYFSQTRVHICQNLQVKMRGHGFPWFKLLLVLLVFAGGFMAHDIRSHGSFTGLSECCQFISRRSTKPLMCILFVCLFQIQPHPHICAPQGSRLYLSRPGEK